LSTGRGTASVKKAIVQIGKDYTETYDALDDNWSRNPVVFQRGKMGDGTFSVNYEYLDDRSGEPAVRYGIVDEERKININTCDMTTLRNVFRIIAGFDKMSAQEAAAAIIDWRDADSNLSIPVGSAEDLDYRVTTYPYESKDAPIEVLEELLLVKGMNQEILDRIRDYITIYGSGKVNVNTASKKVLLSLGIHKDTVDKIIAFRYGDDGEIGTADDNIFYSKDVVVSRLSQYCQMSHAEVAALNTAADMYLVTNSDHFGIKSKAKLNNKSRTAETVCVVDRNGGILYWQEM